MRFLLPLSVFAIATVSSVNAFADDNGWYLGVTGSQQKVDLVDYDLDSVGLVGGYQFNQYFSLEGRYAQGTSSQYIGNIIGDGQDVGDFSKEIGKQMSLLVKGAYPLVGGLSIYGVAGYSKTDLDTKGVIHATNSDFTSFSDTEKESGLTYGAGLSYQFGDSVSAFIEHRKLPDYEIQTVSFDWDVTTVGVVVHF